MQRSATIAARLGVCVSLSWGCSGERWVIGVPLEQADGGSVLDAAAPSCGGLEREGIPAPLPAPLLGSGHAGRWQARLSGDEAAKFPAALVELRLGAELAELRFEAGSAVPPVVNARAGYLCRAPGAVTCSAESGFVAGFDYALYRVTARGSILSFGLFLEQPWDGWCRQQAPVEQRVPGCDPFYDVEAAYTETSWAESCAVRRADQWFGIDCDRLATVERHACVCSADACLAASRARELNLRLVAPDEIEGALWFADDHAVVLHFSREPDASAP